MADREYRAGRLQELIRLNTECGVKEDDQDGHKQLVENLKLARAAAQQKLDDAEQQCIDTHAAQHGVETEYHRAKAAFRELKESRDKHKQRSDAAAQAYEARETARLRAKEDLEHADVELQKAQDGLEAKAQEVGQAQKQFKVRTNLHVAQPVEMITDYVAQDLDNWFQTREAQEPTHQNMSPREPEAKEGEAINAHFPTVIFFEGKWVEWRCKTCGANAKRPKDKKFLQGPDAFFDHERSYHSKAIKGKALTYCSKRVLSDRYVSILCSKMPKSRDGTVTKILDQLQLDVRIEQWYYSKQGKAHVRPKYPRPENRKRSFEAADLQQSLPLCTTPDRRVKAKPTNLFRDSPEEVKYADVMPRD